MYAAIVPHTFRLHWLVSYLIVSVPTQIAVWSLFFVGIWRNDFRVVDDLTVRLQNMGEASLGIGVLLVPVAMRFNHRGRVRVGYFGVEAIDDRGTRRMIDWNNMLSVGIVRYWGWRTLRLKTADGRTFWLPLRVSYPDEYSEVVEGYAGPDHPLSQALCYARPES